jgi:hypothetical protein
MVCSESAMFFIIKINGTVKAIDVRVSVIQPAGDTSLSNKTPTSLKNIAA